jgi:hypothetical protein
MPKHEWDDAPSREEFAAQRADQDRTLVAMHDLEAALGSAAPGREEEWRQRVGDTLETLETVVKAEQAHSLAPDSLLSDLERNHPRLRSRVHGVQAQYANICDTVAGLRRELTATGAIPYFADVRQRLSWVLSALRHLRARESDLLYDAYRDAFGVDIERDPTLPRDETEAHDEPEQLTTKRTDRAQSLGALQHIERRAGTASQGREGDWLDDLRSSAYELEIALSRERTDDIDLFDDIERIEPRLHNRVARLRRQHRDFADAVRDVRIVLDESDPATIDVDDLRRTLDQLANELRYLRARETDLVYEAYTVDLGAGD